MKTIQRNPDVNMDNIRSGEEEMPNGYYAHQGGNLQQTARSARIPFGTAYEDRFSSGRTRLETFGLVIRESDRARFDAALAKKDEAKSRKMAKC